MSYVSSIGQHVSVNLDHHQVHKSSYGTDDGLL